MDMMPGKYFAGFFSHNTLESIEQFAEEIHEFGLIFISLFIVAHMVGHVSHYVHDKGASLKAMITGNWLMPRHIKGNSRTWKWSATGQTLMRSSIGAIIC